MRRALLLALLVLLAGCAGLGDGGDDGPDMGPAPPDPDEDRLGWENGYWYNESIDVTPEDGLNESEREAVVSRSMARVEEVRDLEFEESVPVEVINRSTYREDQSSNHSEGLERFDNAKFEALFLIGEDEASIETQQETRGSTVLGYYSSDREAIVLVAEGDTPTVSGEEVLAHELVHALQDQHFDLGNITAGTRDAYQGRNGIVEGDASYTDRLYTDRCGQEWVCLGNSSADGTATPEGGATDGEEAGNASNVHPGVQILEYFPYGTGSMFVESVHEDGGWEAVNDVYEDVPDGSTEVIYADRYAGWEPAEVNLADRTTEEWERVRPPNRPDYGVMGQSAIVATQAYTITDEFNDSAVVAPRSVVNVRDDGSIDREEPYNYDTQVAAGWQGGRFHAYHGPDGELAYVWRTQWESNAEAAEFAEGWRDVIAHWGGDRVDEDVWVIDEGPYADALSVRVDGDTVTVVNAPERGDIADVHPE